MTSHCPSLSLGSSLDGIALPHDQERLTEGSLSDSGKDRLSQDDLERQALRRRVMELERANRELQKRAGVSLQDDNVATPRGFARQETTQNYIGYVEEPAYVHLLPRSQSPPPACFGGGNGRRLPVPEPQHAVKPHPRPTSTPRAAARGYPLPPPPPPPTLSPAMPGITAADKAYPPPPMPPPEAAAAANAAPAYYSESLPTHLAEVSDAAAQACGWPTLGTVGHPHNCAKACKYHWKATAAGRKNQQGQETKGNPKGCKDGFLCKFCHICSWRQYRQANREQKVDPQYLGFLESMALKAMKESSSS